MGTPSPPAAGPQGCSPSLAWLPTLCSAFQGPTKPPASPLGQIPTRSTPQGERENATRQQHRGASGPACKFSPGCCQPFGRRCLPRANGGDAASPLCGCETAPTAFGGVTSLQPREPPPDPTAQILYSFSPQPALGFALSGDVLHQDPHRIPVESTQCAHEIPTGLLQGSCRIHIGSPQDPGRILAELSLQGHFIPT